MLRVGVRGRELVLHGDQLVAENLAGDVDLRVVHAGNARVPDHALVKQLLQRADLVLISHFRVRSVRIQQVERIDAQVQRGFLGVTNHGFGARIRHPPVLTARRLQMLAFPARPTTAALGIPPLSVRFWRIGHRSNKSGDLHGASIASFRGDQHFISGAIPRSERITHQLFAVPQIFRSASARLARQIIRPSRIQIANTRVQTGMNRTNRSIAIRTPLNRQSHRSHAEPRNRKSCQLTVHHHLPLPCKHAADSHMFTSRLTQREPAQACRAPARR